MKQPGCSWYQDLKVGYFTSPTKGTCLSGINFLCKAVISQIILHFLQCMYSDGADPWNGVLHELHRQLWGGTKVLAGRKGEGG